MQIMDNSIDLNDDLFNLCEIIKSLSENKRSCISLKNKQSTYKFANQNFIELMGLSSLKQLINTNDSMLCDEKNYVRKYQNLDQHVFEEKKALTVDELVMPKHNKPIVKQMHGKIYPIFNSSLDPVYVLGVYTPVNKLIKLDWDTVFQLNHQELKDLLIQKKYTVSLSWGTVELTRREIQLLVELIKGLQAGQIAEKFQLKQTSVESYLRDLKNKLGVTLKSELVDLIITNKLLEQILI